MDFSEKTPFPKDPFFRTRIVLGYRKMNPERGLAEIHVFTGLSKMHTCGQLLRTLIGHADDP